jgi:hypothetical protein
MTLELEVSLDKGKGKEKELVKGGQKSEAEYSALPWYSGLWTMRHCNHLGWKNIDLIQLTI